MVAQRALATLQELPLGERTDTIIRDAAIQRFEYTLEAVWKAAQLYLREREGLDIASPKGVIRACLAVGLLTPEEGRLALKMVDDCLRHAASDRNLTVHTYNETLADAIFSRLAQHAMLMDRWLAALAAGGLED
ncbi:nucleotidyltransferase substrate binding protein [Thermosynechococcus sp. FA-CM-4201]